jgi:hypothetical protein
MRVAVKDSPLTMIFGAACLVVGVLPAAYITDYFLRDLLLMSPDDTRPIRLAGCALQLAGIKSVLSGIKHRRQTYGRLNIFERLVSLRAVQDATLNVVVALEGVSPGELATGAVGVALDASLEQRVASLESTVVSIRNQMKQTDENIKTRIAAIRKVIQDEAARPAQIIEAVRQQTEKAFVDGIDVESIGVFLLIIGVVLATLPNEIAFKFACLAHHAQTWCNGFHSIQCWW